MSDCKHAIGYSTLYYDGINGYLIYENDNVAIRELLDEDCAYSSELDYRKIFAFCPMCGERIDWDAVQTKKRLSEL